MELTDVIFSVHTRLLIVFLFSSLNLIIIFFKIVLSYAVFFAGASMKSY